MKRYFTLLIGWLGLFLMTSCQQDNLTASGEAFLRGGFVLDYAVPESRVSTYATVPMEPGEDQINDLYVLFFEETTGGTGNFLGYYEVPTKDQDGNATPLSSKGQIRVDFKDVRVTEDPSADPLVDFLPEGVYSLLLVANVKEFIEEGIDVLTWISNMHGKSENVVLASHLLKICGAEDEQDNGHTIQRDNLPMGARVKRATGQHLVSVELCRSVSRIDVKNYAPDYRLVSASIWNAYPTSPAWENVLTTYQSPRISRFYGVATSTNEIVGNLYVLENGTSASTPTDNVTTCVILGFEKNDTLYYYRANVNVTSIGQRLQRNNAYRLNIKSVHGPGELCEQDAYTSGKFLLDLAVNEWNIDEQGNVLSNGQNVLTVPTQHIVFTPAAESRSYSIYTAGPGTLELSRSHLPGGITAELTGKTLTVSVSANEEERDGYIELRLEDLKIVITIKQTGNLDKYIELSRYSVPAFPGNGIFQMDGNVTVTSSGPWSARIYGKGFTFQFRGTAVESPMELNHYPAGEAFTITSLGTNPSLEPRYAFISIYLDEDPGIHQVLVISQEGKTSFKIYPVLDSDHRFDFNAVGTRTKSPADQPDKYEIKVDGMGYGEWKVEIPALYADLLQVRYYDETGNYLPAATSAFGHGFFDIVASVNTTGAAVNTTARIVLLDNADDSQTIPITQGTFQLAFTGTSDRVPALGGTSFIGLQLTPEWPEGSWEAKVKSSLSAQMNFSYTPIYQTAYFGATAGTTTASGDMDKTIDLSYTKLPLAFMHERKEPGTTVEVTVAGVKQSFTIYQGMPVWRDLRVQTYAKDYDGNLTEPSGGGKDDHFDYFYYAIHNETGNKSFHSAAYLYGSPSNLPYVTKTKNFLSFATGSDIGDWAGGIINLNLSIKNYDTYKSDIIAWLNTPIPELYNAPANFMLLLGDNYPDVGDRRYMLWSLLGVDCYGSGTSNVNAIGNAPSSGTIARKVWDYIYVNGPFGPVNRENVSLRIREGYNGYINKDSGIPASTVSLLEDEGNNNRIRIAIDPVKRLLFIGNVELFGSNGTYGQNDSYLINSDEIVFMRNLIAFMINTAQYGDYFLSYFNTND